MTRGFAVGWRQVFAVMILLACCGMVASTYGVVAVPLANEFHPNRMTLMMAMTVMSVVSGITAPIVGGLMDRMSVRLIMTIGIAGLIGGYFALSFATSFTQVLVVFGLFLAASQSMSGPVAGTVLLSRWFDKRRGTALGIAIAGIAAGTMIFPLIIQFLLNHFAWRDAMRMLALILAVLTIPALAMLVNRPEDRGLHPDGADTPPARTAAAAAPALSTRDIVTDPAFWLLAVVVSVVLAGMMGAVINVVPMARDFGVEAGAAAFIITVYAVTGLVAKLGFGFAADRFNARALMLGVLALFGLGMAGLGLSGSGYAFILFSAALVGCGGMMIPLQSFLTSRIFGPTVVGKASGLLSLAILCGMLVTPPIFGFIFDRTGSYSAIFLTFAALSALSMLLVPKLRLHPRGAADPAESDGAQPSLVAS